MEGVFLQPNSNMGSHCPLCSNSEWNTIKCTAFWLRRLEHILKHEELSADFVVTNISFIRRMTIERAGSQRMKKISFPSPRSELPTLGRGLSNINQFIVHAK